MIPTFSLTNQTLPLKKMKIPVFQLKKFLESNNIKQINSNFKQNEVTASQFSNLFSNIQCKETENDIIFCDIKQQRQSLYQSKSPAFRIFIPQNKTYLQDVMKKNNSFVKEQKLESRNVQTRSSKTRCKSNSYSHQSNQSNHQRRRINNSELQDYLNINGTDQSYQDDNHLQDIPSDQNEFNSSMNNCDANQEQDLQSQLLVAGSKIHDQQQVNNFELKSRIIIDEKQQKFVPNIISHKLQVQKDLMKFKICQPIKQMKRQILDTKYQPSYMFIEDDRNRFGQQKYPKSNQSQTVQPGPGSYSLNENSLNQRVLQMNHKKQNQYLIKQWQNFSETKIKFDLDSNI